MFSSSPSSVGQVRKTDRLIQNWLKERQELIVKFNQLCALKPFSSKSPHLNLIEETLTEFGQILVDYVSCGQFEVFEHISSAHEKTPCAQQALDKTLFIQLFKTTVSIIELHDNILEDKPISNLDQRLSELGLALAKRFDYEDQLIDLYFSTKATLQKDPAASSSNTPPKPKQ